MRRSFCEITNPNCLLDMEMTNPSVRLDYPTTNAIFVGEVSCCKLTHVEQHFLEPYALLVSGTWGSRWLQKQTKKSTKIVRPKKSS